MKSKHVIPVAFTILLGILAICPAFADYSVGQKVEFRDDYLGYGGGWVPAVITEDHGPAAVERYVVKIESFGAVNARVGLLRPTDGSPRMIPKTPAENNYKGPEAEAAADAITEKRKAFQQSQQPPQNTHPVVQPAGAAQTGSPSIKRQAPATAPPATATAPAGFAHGRSAANSHAAILGKGIFPNGKPLGTPGQTNFMLNSSGNKSIVCVAPPGQESFIGRWNLKAGGSWSKVLGSEKDMGGGKTEYSLEYNFPVAADVLVISGDKTWFKQFAGTRTAGSWFDLGQNVVQLVAFDNDDWTGSVIKGQMEIRSPTGMWEYGRRF